MSIPVQLWLLLDSRSPAGAHSHSGGMEAAVAAGFVNTTADVAEFCRGRLHTSGRVAAGFAAAACQAWEQGWKPDQWFRLDAEFGARLPSAATRAASRTQGSGLYRLLRAIRPDQRTALRESWLSCPMPAPHHCMVLGAAASITGGNAQIAARAAALAGCTGPSSAAIRLLGLDPYAVHSAVAALAGEIEQVADAVSESVRDLDSADPSELADPARLPSDSSPALDLLADVHAQMEVRLFAS
jgi:urease accessory protein